MELSITFAPTAGFFNWYCMHFESLMEFYTPAEAAVLNTCTQHLTAEPDVLDSLVAMTPTALLPSDSLPIKKRKDKQWHAEPQANLESCLILMDGAWPTLLPDDEHVAASDHDSSSHTPSASSLADAVKLMLCQQFATIKSLILMQSVPAAVKDVEASRLLGEQIQELLERLHQYTAAAHNAARQDGSQAGHEAEVQRLVRAVMQLVVPEFMHTLNANLESAYARAIQLVVPYWLTYPLCKASVAFEVFYKKGTALKQT